MSKATKLFPILRHWTHDAPHAVHIVETKAAADALIEGGAFTDDPNHPDRDHDAPDVSGDLVAPGSVAIIGENGPEIVLPSAEPEPA